MGGNSKYGLGSIRYKILFLILILSLASFIGFGIFMVNSVRMQKIARFFSENYNESLALENINKFNAFLDTIQESAGISQNFGELFHLLREFLDRDELMEVMEREYHVAFARETSLLGGGAFYEPYAFFPEVHRFHYFCSKELTPEGGVPPEAQVKWVGYDIREDEANEWEWDVDTYEEGWYLVALPKGWSRTSPRSDRYYWSELYVDDSVNALMVTVSLPIYSMEKRIVGVATVDVSLLTLQEMVNAFELPTSSAQIAGFSTADNATFAIKGDNNTDIVPYPKDNWLIHLTALKPGQEIINPNLVVNGVSNTLIASVHDSGIGLAVLVPNAEKSEAADAVQRVSIIAAAVICLAMIVIIAVILIALSRLVIAPITRASLVIETMAKGDLTQTIAVKGTDELAQMMRTLGLMQENIKNLIKAIGEKARTLASVGIDMQNMMNDSVSEINNINASTKDMKTKSSNQAEDVAKTNAAIGQILTNIENLDSHIEEQTESISKSSLSIEEMISNITSITASLAQNEQDLQRLRGASSEGNSSLQKVSADIQEVSKESERLLEINKVIQNIASQTNLLAMNAAIEAAHAGNVGRGFAVVADEIRKLAESSSQQAKTVSSVLKNIKDALGGIGTSTLASLKQFDDIEKGFETVSTQSIRVRDAMEQQDTGNKNVLAAMGESNEITKSVRSNSSKIQSASREVVGKSKHLESLTGEVTNAISEIASGMDNIETAVRKTSEISKKNKEDIDSLLQEISKFNI
ncbi:MAG: methyl-accepting chemotaxis protein [Treponema sp.]|nr:methyl-accepting chemotaxis protein [Treponema sp.]